MPGDSPGIDRAWRPDSSPWEFLFGDGAWHLVRVTGWWLDKDGEQVVQIEWHADGSTWEESYLVDPVKLRRG